MTRWPRSLHGRLTLAYALAFFAGLTVFAYIAFVSMDAALKAVVDNRIRNAEGRIAAILTADPKVNHDTRERIDLVVGSSVGGIVLTANGRAVYSSVTTIAPNLRAVIFGAGDAARLSGLHFAGFAGRIAVQRIVANDHSVRYVGVWRPLGLVHGLEQIRLLAFAGSVVVIGALAVLVGSLVARQGLKPLRALAALTSEIEAQDLSRRLGVASDSSELGQLATTFDRMLERLENAFERQRNFTADASHELRAPLAVVRMAADLTLRRDRETTDYRRVLTSISEATRQLEDLTERLLAAARADAGHVSIERLDLATVVAETLDRLTPLAEAKGIELRSSLEPDAFVNADRSGVTRTIVALVDNAIKFSPERGTVTATVVNEDGRIRLTVQDQGPGFSAEGLTHATKRYWRSEPARSARQGTGLGLAICDAIVRASGGSLTPQNAVDRGALVVVEFAVA